MQICAGHECVYLTKQTHVHELKDFILHYYRCTPSTFPFFTILRNHMNITTSNFSLVSCVGSYMHAVYYYPCASIM